MSKKTSIIVVAYDINRLQRQITSACLGNIEKFTDRNEYELILVDQKPVSELDTRHNYFKIDKHIVLDKHIGMSAAMNLGAKKSKGKYFCFMHNDVLVWEGWLSILRSFLEKDPNGIIMPHQGRTSREEMKKFYKEENPRGNDDAGLVMMSKEIFKQTGGWDERFKAIYQDAAFRLRFSPIKYWCTGKVVITHIGCGTVYALSEEEEKRAYDEETPIYNKIRK